MLLSKGSKTENPGLSEEKPGCDNFFLILHTTVRSTVYDAALSFSNSDYGNINNIVFNTIHKTITCCLQFDFITIRHT